MTHCITRREQASNLRCRFLLQGLLAITLGISQTAAETILIDDFNDGVADGWTVVDSTIGTPWGPGTMDVNGKGEYRFEGNGLVPHFTPGDGFLGSLWDASSNLMYSDGFFRGRVRLGYSNKAGLAMRQSGTPETGFSGYLFRVTTAHAPNTRLLIDRIENNVKTEGSTFNFPVPVDEDLMLEAGAVGEQLSLKVWPATEPEPAQPQLLWTDATFPSGMLGLEANTLGRFPLLPRVSATFDDLFFVPAADALGAEKRTTIVPEPSGLSGVILAVIWLGFVSRRRLGKNDCCRTMPRAIRTTAVRNALFLGCAVTVTFVLSAQAPAQVVFDLGSFPVDTDAHTSNKTLSIPTGTYNAYSLSTDWSHLSGGAWSREAMWTLADGPLGESPTTYYSYEGSAPNSAADENTVTLVWDGFLDLPITGPLDMSLIPLQFFGGSTGHWANTVIEFSFATPPSGPTLSADLGIVTNPFSPLSIITSGDFDTELAVYSSTGAMIRSNDDAPGSVTHSAINFSNGLPTGDYIAALGGFNTTFDDSYEIIAGATGGNFSLSAGGGSVAGSLDSNQVAYIGFTVGAVGAECDFNLDASCDINDLNALLLEGPIALGVAVVPGENEEFDVTSDGVIDDADVGQWLADAASANGFAEPYLKGDTNLDGTVSAIDLNNMALNWGAEVLHWSGGDFNGDGSVTAIDLNDLALNWGQSIPMASALNSAVPEPSAWLLTIAGLVLWRRQ